MSPVLFIVIPLFTAFLAPGFKKLKPVREGWLPTLFLLATAAMAAYLLPRVMNNPINQIIVIAPPLGINLYAGAFAVTTIFITSLFGILIISSPRMRLYFSDTIAANVLILLHFAGLNGLLLSGDLFNIYVFLEIASLSAYAITAFNDDAKSFEAALKYLLAGSFISILLLVGIGAVYFHTGTLNLARLSELAGSLSLRTRTFIAVALVGALLIEGEFFPLNTWVPDVYQGSGSAVSGLFSTVTININLYVLFRVLTVFGFLEDMRTILLWIGLITLLAGELGALRQKDLTRLLGYSTIAQVGLLLAGFVSNAQGGTYLYLLNHTAVKSGLFLILILTEKDGSLEDLRGMGRKNPLIGIAGVILSLSLLGLPPFAGFSGKLLILRTLIAGEGVLTVILILAASLIEAWYLLRILSVLFSREEGNDRIPPGKTIILLLPVLFVLLAGILPGIFFKGSMEAERELYDTTTYQEQVL